MTPKDVIPKEIPVAENAAPLYESAFALLNSLAVGNEPFSASFSFSKAVSACEQDPDSDAKLAALERLLADPGVVRAMQLIDKATARPRCNFDLPYEQGAMMLVPHVNGMLRARRFQAAQSLLDARRGNAREFWRGIETSFLMADALREEPVLISALVRLSLLKSTASAIVAHVDRVPPDDETAARLDGWLLNARDVAPIVLAMDGERLNMGEWLFDENNAQRLVQAAIDAGGPNLEPRHLAWLLSCRPARQAEHAAYLRTLKQCTDNLSRPFWEIPPVPQPEKSMSQRWYGGILHSFAPAFYGVRTTTATLQAQIDVARVGLALLRHKAALGSYPPSLAEIDSTFLAEIPPDPFTGQPLVYRPEADGFLLYSLGQNLKDDGGTPESPETRESKAFDLVWRSSN
ncbi:MAG: hypothetical protein EOM72_11640 [Opitutae bacterium]|nr:hypothetical protein [Opitutae bacterium]